MVSIIECDVAKYGSLHGGTEGWSDLDLALYPWDMQPFPAITERLEFQLVPGEERKRANVWRHNLLQDFVCDAKAYGFFTERLSRDIHVVARARCGSQELTVLQVVSKLDVADKKRSLRRPRHKTVIEFPHVASDKEQLAAGRIFRIQQKAPQRMILAGDDVMEDIKEAGLVGFAFDRAWVHRD
jgi:hypothetical protein